MSDFLQAYERMIVNEGGYVLHTVKNDRGGQTYAGIARNAWPKWAGWAYIDAGDTPPAEMVRGFYRSNFWTPLRLEEVQSQDVVMVCAAALILSFLATLYPAWRAARTQPAEALRYE